MLDNGIFHYPKERYQNSSETPKKNLQKELIFKDNVSLNDVKEDILCGADEYYAHRFLLTFRVGLVSCRYTVNFLTTCPTRVIKWAGKNLIMRAINFPF